MSNDIIFTQSVYDYLVSLKAKKLGSRQTSIKLLEKTVTDSPLDDLNTSDFEDILLDEEDDDDDALSAEDEALMKQDDANGRPQKHKIIPLELEDVKEDDGKGKGNGR